MTSRIVALVLVVVLGVFVCAPPAGADESPLKPSIGIGVGADYFTWREVSVCSLRESGPRGAVSLFLDNENRNESGLVYDMTVQGYIGHVYYDGSTQPDYSTNPPTCSPVTTHTSYLGIGGELGGGYRFNDVFKKISLDVLGSIGVDRWRRTINGTQSASGAREDYRIIYARLGLGLYRIFNKWSHYIKMGAKRPFSTREVAKAAACSANTETYVLSPKGGESFYLKWQINRLSEDNRREFSLMFYYDSYQFNISNYVTGAVPGCIIHQPDSHQNVFGTQIGYYFDLF